MHYTHIFHIHPQSTQLMNKSSKYSGQYDSHNEAPVAHQDVSLDGPWLKEPKYRFVCGVSSCCVTTTTTITTISTTMPTATATATRMRVFHSLSFCFCLTLLVTTLNCAHQKINKDALNGDILVIYARALMQINNLAMQTSLLYQY